MNTLTPKEALNKAFLKVKPTVEEINNFKAALKLLRFRISVNESEEYNKNIVRDFFKEIAFSNYNVNTSERIDLSIAELGRNLVIFEVKKERKHTSFPLPLERGS